MQTIQNHVTSLPLAKKLVEVGIKIESEFYWWCDTYGTDAGKPKALKDHKPRNPKGGWTYYPAPLASELGEVLPMDKIDEIRVSRGGSGDWYFSMEAGGGGVQFFGETMPDAMAEFVIYLKEKGLI